MIKTAEDYENSLQRLQVFLDAIKPPPVGSEEAEIFESLLDAVTAYEVEKSS